jgi:hypothetical protein
MDCVVHGDDFTILGYDEDLDELIEAMGKWFEIKVRGKIGPESGDQKSMTILNRTIDWLSWGIQITADPKHVERFLGYFGLGSESTSVVCPGKKEEVPVDDVNEELDEAIEDLEKLEGALISQYRGLAATLNYLAQDRFDVQFTGKELSREMSSPTKSSMARAKRAARYLLGAPVVKIVYVNQRPPSQMKTYVDSDWAGCMKTRKSTSAGVILFGLHCIRTWSTTQGSLATSSAEAEFYAIIEGGSRTLGMASLGKDLGCSLKAIMYSDASAGRSMVFRKGLGRVRHLETKYLWIQDVVRAGRIQLLKVKGVENPADIGTKYLSLREMSELLGGIGVRVCERSKV